MVSDVIFRAGKRTIELDTLASRALRLPNNRVIVSFRERSSLKGNIAGALYGHASEVRELLLQLIRDIDM